MTLGLTIGIKGIVVAAVGGVPNIRHNTLGTIVLVGNGDSDSRAAVAALRSLRVILEIIECLVAKAYLRGNRTRTILLVGISETESAYDAHLIHILGTIAHKVGLHLLLLQLAEVCIQFRLQCFKQFVVLLRIRALQSYRQEQ